MAPAMTATGVTFQRERAQDCFEEALPLLQAHWKETVSPELTLDPDWDAYRVCEDAGTLYAYGLREDGRLHGYAVYFLQPSLHSKQTHLASQDLLYIAPAYRGPLAVEFLEWVHAQLKVAGADTVTAHVSVRKDYGPLLRYLGYEQLSTFWMRRF